jgi:hypothetical protein
MSHYESFSEVSTQLLEFRVVSWSFELAPGVMSINRSDAITMNTQPVCVRSAEKIFPVRWHQDFNVYKQFGDNVRRQVQICTGRAAGFGNSILALLQLT